MKPRNTEQIDGKNLLGCKMNSIFPRTLDLLVSDGGSGSCKLVKHDGTELTSQVRINNFFFSFSFFSLFIGHFFLVSRIKIAWKNGQILMVKIIVKYISHVSKLHIVVRKYTNLKSKLT